MPLIKKIPVFDGLLLIWELSETTDQLKQLIPEAASTPEFQSLNNPKRQKEWLATRLLLKEINCAHTQLSYDKNGRPHIHHPQYKQISISHSDKLAGIFMHPSQTIGLDIENVNRDFIRVEKKYLSPQEMELARTINNGHGLFWCIKEATYKAAGIPGIHFSKEIHINLLPDKELSVALSQQKQRLFNICHFLINKQLVVCLIDRANE